MSTVAESKKRLTNSRRRSVRSEIFVASKFQKLKSSVRSDIICNFPDMPLLTGLESFSISALQIFRAYGAAEINFGSRGRSPHHFEIISSPAISNLPAVF
jgi:hypothetical protein